MTAGSNAQHCNATAPDASRLCDEQSLAAAIEEEILLRAHDAAWAEAFERERDRLRARLPGVFVAIEPTGGTAVPGLVAKPIIDIVAAVESLDGVDALMRISATTAARRRRSSTQC